MVYKSEGGERNWSLPSGELHQLLIGYQKQLISECLFLLLWSRWSLSVTLAGGGGSSSCLFAEDCSLIIDHQNVFTCQTSKTSKSSGRHPLCECLPSFTPSTHRDFILKWHTPAAGSEISHYRWNFSRKKFIIHGYFQNKSQLAKVLNCFCPTGNWSSWVSCFTSTTYVIFDSSSFSGGFLFWWHLVAASVVLIGPETLQEVTKRKNWDMLLVL